MDRRPHHCLAQSLPKARQGLGESQPKGARVLAPRLNPPHAQKTLQSGLKSPDGLLHIDSSISGGQSVSRQLTASIVARLKQTTPGLEITYRDLAIAPVPHQSPTILFA